ncbi:MAG: hypothetical protein ABI306_08220, partial [Caulobacteraceae bacterium]
MNRTSIVGALAALGLLVGCAGGPGYYGGGPGVGVNIAYDGYYDGFYGPIYDGYWRGRSFYWRDRDDHPFRRDDGRHFRRAAAQ